jgi:phosphoglycolate phosphatase
MECRGKMIKKPKAIIFDWDGTLVDSLPLLFKSHNHVRKTYGYPLWSMEEYKGQMYRSSLDLYPELYGDKADEALDCLYSFFSENHIQNLSIIPGAFECLEFLKQENILMGLVSNKKDEYLKKETHHLGWHLYFEHIVGAGGAAKDKPHPEPVFESLKVIDLAPDKEQIWYVGDTRTDIETAKNANCMSVLLTHGENKQDLIEQYDPDLVFDSFDQLIDPIKKNYKKKAC